MVVQMDFLGVVALRQRYSPAGQDKHEWALESGGWGLGKAQGFHLVGNGKWEWVGSAGLNAAASQSPGCRSPTVLQILLLPWPEGALQEDEGTPGLAPVLPRVWPDEDLRESWSCRSRSGRAEIDHFFWLLGFLFSSERSSSLYNYFKKHQTFFWHIYASFFTLKCLISLEFVLVWSVAPTSFFARWLPFAQRHLLNKSSLPHLLKHHLFLLLSFLDAFRRISSLFHSGDNPEYIP